MKEVQPRGTGQWIGLALGLPFMVVGVRGILLNSGRTHPPDLTRWLVGSALVHDGLVLPLVLLVGFFGHRLVPTTAWPAVRWVLFTTGVVLLVGWPFLRGYGRRADNPSLLPRNYAVGTLLALGLLWGGTAAWLTVQHRRRQRRADDGGGGQVSQSGTGRRS